MPRYVAQCDLVLTAPNGSPDYVKQGEQRDFDEAPTKGRFVKWLPLDGEPERPRKKSTTDIDKPKTGIAASDVIV